MGDDQGWADAQRVLDGVADNRVRGQQRRRRTWFLALLVVALVIVVAVGIVAGVTSGGGHGAEAAPPPWREVLGTVLSACAAVACVVGLVKLLRVNGVTQRWSSPLVLLSRRQRRSLMRQVRGQEPVDVAHLPLALFAAKTLMRQRPLLLVMLGLVLGQLGIALSSQRTWQVGLAAFIIVLMGFGAVRLERDVRRARLFLDRQGA